MKKNLRILIVTNLLVITIIFIALGHFSSELYNINENQLHPEESSFSISKVHYTNNEPIKILSNEEFNSTENVTGNGSEANPYLINNFNIVNSTHTLIYIANTTANFTIVDCNLDGVSKDNNGIVFVNVTNGNIVSSTISKCYNGIKTSISTNISISLNSIYDNKRNGIYFSNTNNSILVGNRIFDNGGNPEGSGVLIDPSNYNVIFNNTIFNNSVNGLIINNSIYNLIESNNISFNGYQGINLLNSSYNTIAGNLIRDNGGNPEGSGVLIDPSNYNVIFNNTIFNNSVNGVLVNSSVYNLFESNNISFNGYQGVNLFNSSYNTIAGNSIHDNGGNPEGSGVLIDPSTYNTIVFNCIYNNSINGIYLLESSNTTIIGNRIEDNYWYGINISSDADNCFISLNDFINNVHGLSKSQVIDNGSNNVFIFNHWDHHSTVDTNTDGIADKAYKINGTANNYDNYPSISSQHICQTCLTTEPELTSMPSSTTTTITTTITTIDTTTTTTMVNVTYELPLITLFLTLIAIIHVRRFKNKKY
jgi:parallel beta-helix repeat protein